MLGFFDDDVPQNAIFVNPESEFVTALKSDIKNDSGMLVSRQLWSYLKDPLNKVT